MEDDYDSLSVKVLAMTGPSPSPASRPVLSGGQDSSRIRVEFVCEIGLWVITPIEALPASLPASRTADEGMPSVTMLPPSNFNAFPFQNNKTIPRSKNDFG